MELFATTSSAHRRAGSCVIVGVYENGEPGAGAADIDSASKGRISRLIKDGDISGKTGRHPFPGRSVKFMKKPSAVP